jgi:phage/plasmid-associated DNA primase
MVEMYREINTDDTIKFDNNWKLLGFENIVYDLENGNFRDYMFDDYISTTTGYEWKEPLKEDIALINDLISQIMPVKEERELYLQILASALDGKCLEKFIIFNGSGGNGKGMIDDLLLCALGNYGFIGNNSILFENNKMGSNPEKANIHKKRLVIFREPPENKKFENSIIKEFTGGGTFCARGHHETNTKKELNLTMIVEANKKPLLAEEPTDADIRRIIDIYFRSSYTEDKSKVDNANNIYLANTYYKTSEFQNKYKYALLHILFEEYKKYKNNNFHLFVPKSIEERTKLYLELSNNIVQWFKDNYKNTNNSSDICKMKDLYDDFSGSNYFVNLTKSDKRKYNKTYFNNYIIENNFFKKYYVARTYTKESGEVKNCVINWKKIVEESDNLCDS